MRAILLLGIVPIAVGIGGCASDAVSQDPSQAPEVANNPAAQADDAPAQVTIRGLSWAGTGCPAGSVAGYVAPDAFTLLFDSYVAQIGPGVPPRENRKNCQILVDLNFPQGWSYSVFTVDYRGFANLESGVWGIQQSNYYFSTELPTSRLQTTYKGPQTGDFQIRDILGISELNWSPCDVHRPLNINSSIRVENHSSISSAQGEMTTDSIDGKVMLKYGLQWQHCPV